MTIEDLGNIGDFIGGIGVIVTLAFLIFQIRQNTAQLRQQNALSSSSAARSTREAVNEIYRLLAGNQDASRVWWAGVEDRNALEGSDLQQFDALAAMSWQAHLEAFKQGDPEALATIDYVLVKFPGMRQWLDDWGPSLPAAFREYLTQRSKAAAQQSAAADSAQA